MTRNNVTRNMTEGDPLKLILAFSVPLMFGLFFQQLYSFVDAAIVGRFLGTSALAAVGSTGSVNFLVLGFCMGICSGFGIPISQAFGAGDERALRRYTASACYLALGISVLFAVGTGLCSTAALRAMNTPADILNEAAAYIRIIFFAIPVTVVYNLAGSVLRAVGDSRTPVLFLVAASLINIALDLVFILIFHMGVTGAAWATVISQLFAGIGCVRTVLKHLPMLTECPDDLKFRKRYVLKTAAMGVPMGLQYSITAVGSIVMQTAVNGLGTGAVAAVTAAGKLYSFFTCVFDALATAMATFCGQHVGAARAERIPAGLRAAGVIGTVYSFLVLGLVCLLGGRMLGIFLGDDTDGPVAAMAMRYMVTNVAFFVPLLFVNIVRFSIQGMGFTRLAMVAGVFEMVARTLVAVALVPRFGFDAACFANPLAWVMADVFLFPCFVRTWRSLMRRGGGRTAEQGKKACRPLKSIGY
ncbi:MAG: MATE family efflux transporter [Clostridia bacterium]|nr:MATE family efflux transporter [Clostridia bacterium]